MLAWEGDDNFADVTAASLSWRSTERQRLRVPGGKWGFHLRGSRVRQPEEAARSRQLANLIADLLRRCGDVMVAHRSETIALMREEGDCRGRYGNFRSD
jgi:hypothetical protein